GSHAVGGALQELEDVLHHVAAWGGWLDPAAYPVPLHSRPEHQTRSLRAGRWHEREVGVCNGRFARCPCDRVPVRLEHAAHRPAAVAEALGDVREVSAAPACRELQPHQHPRPGQEGRPQVTKRLATCDERDVAKRALQTGASALEVANSRRVACTRAGPSGSLSRHWSLPRCLHRRRRSSSKGRRTSSTSWETTSAGSTSAPTIAGSCPGRRPTSP